MCYSSIYTSLVRTEKEHDFNKFYSTLGEHLCFVMFIKFCSRTLNVTILLTAFMSYHMYHCITRKSPASYTLTSSRLYRITGLVALYATVVAAVPLFRNGYGLDGSQCWLVTEHTHQEHTVFTTLVLYAPLWLCIGYSMGSYVTIFQYVRRIGDVSYGSSTTVSVVSSRRTSASQQTESVVWKLMYYPGLFCFCFCSGDVIRCCL